MSEKRGISLSRAQRVMAVLIRGRAPSLSTLQRHAAAGALASCELPGSGKRVLYDLNKLRLHYRHWAQAEPPSSPTCTSGASPGDLPIRQDHLEQVAGVAIAPLVGQIVHLSKEVAALNGVRSSLMLKYDAASALSLDRAERLAQQLAEARKLVDLDLRVARLTVEVSKLAELLNSRLGVTQ